VLVPIITSQHSIFNWFFLVQFYSTIKKCSKEH